MVRIDFTAVVALFALTLLGCQPRPVATAPLPPAADLPLISRAALFGAPARTDTKISPDGRQIAFLAPHLGQLNVFVMAAGAGVETARPLTVERERGVRRFQWAANSRHILYLNDANGDENWRVFAVDSEATTPTAQMLTPATGVQATLIGTSPTQPDVVLVSLNDRDRAFADVWRIDLTTGTRARVLRNTARLSEFVADYDNRVRLAQRVTPAGDAELVSLGPDGRVLRVLAEIPFADRRSTRVLGFEADHVHALMVDSTDRDRAALVRLNTETGVKESLGESPVADVVDAWRDPRTGVAEAYGAEYLKLEWRPLTEDARADLAALDAAFEGEPRVISRSLDDTRWIVVEDGPTAPMRTYTYERQSDRPGPVRLLFDTRPALNGAPLQPMSTQEIRSRDGLTLVAYLTLPAGVAPNGANRPQNPTPLVLVVHGGPWSRDSYGFNPTHQWLANRGYTALSVNFRGSTGFGKAFVAAGNGEWGGRMQDDLLDAVDWAVRERIADPAKVAIIGASYGGYATLAGLAFHPERYACGASLVGPSNLETLMASLPASWANDREDIFRRVGDPRTPAGRELLRAHSPLNRATDIRRPLLIGQGATDPRVPQAESDQIVSAMRRASLPVTYLVFPEEGHGFGRPQNRLAYQAVLEGFLAGCLGGRREPAGGDFEGSRFIAREGADTIADLPEAARPPRLVQGPRPSPPAPSVDPSAATGTEPVLPLPAPKPANAPAAQPASLPARQAPPAPQAAPSP